MIKVQVVEDDNIRCEYYVDFDFGVTEIPDGFNAEKYLFGFVKSAFNSLSFLQEKNTQ